MSDKKDSQHITGLKSWTRRNCSYYGKYDIITHRVTELCAEHPEIEEAVSNLQKAGAGKQNAQRKTNVDVAYRKLESTLAEFVEGEAVAHQLARYVKHLALNETLVERN